MKVIGAGLKAFTTGAAMVLAMVPGMYLSTSSAAPALPSEVMTTEAPPNLAPEAVPKATFIDMIFHERRTPITLPTGDVIGATLAGNMDVSPAGDVNGVVDVRFDDGSGVTIAVTDNEAMVRTDGVVIDLKIQDGSLGEFVVVGENVPTVPVAIGDIIEDFADEARDNRPPGQYSPISRALLGLLVLQSTPQYQRNVAADRAGPEAAKKWWCKATAIVAAALLYAIVQAGCVLLTGKCAAATGLSLGAMLIPCAWAILKCQAFALVTGAAAYQAVVSLWKP